jgi:hypothetical protein
VLLQEGLVHAAEGGALHHQLRRDKAPVLCVENARGKPAGGLLCGLRDVAVAWCWRWDGSSAGDAHTRTGIEAAGIQTAVIIVAACMASA